MSQWTYFHRPRRIMKIGCAEPSAQYSPSAVAPGSGAAPAAAATSERPSRSMPNVGQSPGAAQSSMVGSMSTNEQGSGEIPCTMPGPAITSGTRIE